MSWKFAGIIFKRNYVSEYPELLKRLGVEFYQSADGFTFSDAISRENTATALGQVNSNTHLLHPLLPYDCSYEPGEEMARLDEMLLPLSHQGDIMNYIIDGVSGTYCFSVFSAGRRVRRWAVEPGRVLCNDGEWIDGESMATSGSDAARDIFSMSIAEAHLFAVWEAFAGVSFQDLVQSEAPQFHFFL